jgi:catechol-2,3-dioxygenase
MIAPNTNSKMTRGSAVKALGEVALRVNNLEQMKRFYQEVLGFEVLGESPAAALLKIAPGYAGHTQVLGLFDRSVSVDQERTTVDHIAFAIGLPDYDSEKKRLETLGLNVETTEHEWIKWRSLYFHDPEGNQVELVCYDENIE